jgi:hypothetical protein
MKKAEKPIQILLFQKPNPQKNPQEPNPTTQKKGKKADHPKGLIKRGVKLSP